MSFSNIFKQNDDEREKLVLTDNIFKTIVLLSLPVMFMLLVQSFIQIFDNWFVYNYSTLSHGAAMAYSNTALQIAINGGIGLSVAGTALIGRLNGAGDKDAATLHIKQFIFLMLATSLIVSAITAFGATFYASMAIEEIRSGVFTIMSLSAFGIPFQYFNTAYYAIKNASGKSEIPFAYTTLLLVLKVIFNAIFVAFMDLNITGIVLSNFFSQFIISVIISKDVFWGKNGMRVSFKKFKVDMQVIKNFLKVGIPSVVTNITMSVGFLLINIESMKFGREVLNAMNIGNSVTNLAYSTLNSFGTSITSIVSMNIGAKNYKRAKDCVISVFKLATVLSLIVTIIIIIISPFTARMFTDVPIILDMVDKTQIITILGVHGFATASIMCGVFVALGQTKIPLLIGALRVIVLRYLFILVISRLFTTNYLVIPFATLFSNAGSLVVAWVLYSKIDWSNPLAEFSFKKSKKIKENYERS